jgi:acetolactate synthase-1/2/3 large subunit
MKVSDAVAQILKREGVEFLIGYPVNHVIEASARADIRTIIVRQERTGLHMADAVSRVTSGEKIGVFCMQHGPGTENAFGGVAQAYGDSVPIVVIPGGFSRTQTFVPPNFNAYLNFQHISKSCEQVYMPKAVPDAMRRAFMQVRNGRPRPAVVEIPNDIMNEEIGDFDYHISLHTRSAPDPREVDRVAAALVEAERPVIYAGQGVHYAKAWDALRELAELLEAPVTTSLEGKSAIPENHPLYLGAGGRTTSLACRRFLDESDLIFGIGCSFTVTNSGVSMPRGKKVVHSTLDPADLGRELPCDYALVGDAELTLRALIEAVRERTKGQPRGRRDGVVAQIKKLNDEWMSQWLPKLTSEEVPINPYRVIWDLLHTVDVTNTTITHDAGSPRDQMSPFWQSITPLSYIGWGKTTQLGYGLGLATGAKLARPEQLCINWWGDAAIGVTGMDFETAVRERIPILSVLSNNYSMAIELKIMEVATEKFRSTDISGNYADMAKAFGGYGERVTTPDQIIPAIKRGIEQTREGKPALLEFITQQETQVSVFR